MKTVLWKAPLTRELYDKHYNASDLEQKDSEYTKAMDSILNNLIRQETFRNLKTSIDFSCLRAEHNY
ncbi:hypothetical protein LEP1GSC088_2919 [Leptospira interrogans str. L1207]|nr:hypothetical protein LEP1GSC088_2919 [Leptospira interrogans str. L1207]